MNSKYLSKIEAEKIMAESSGDINKLRNSTSLNADYEKIRKELLSLNYQILFKYFGYNGDITKETNIKSYNYDLRFAIELYQYFNEDEQLTLSERDASDPEFWSFLSVAVIPDIVIARWDVTSYERLYSQPSRIWLYTLWWYIHLSWQDDITETFDILKNNSTDTILNLVERVGPKGYNLDLYRNIMSNYSKIDKSTILNQDRDIFRTIMVNNTALSQTIEPALYNNGVDGYVQKLFEMSNLYEENGKYVYRELN